MIFFREGMCPDKHPFVPDVTSLGHQERYLMAGSETTPLQALAQLSYDPSGKVRKRVAENPNTPVQTLGRLAMDTDWEVRVGVAENPNAPLPLLYAISFDDHSDVRFALAENIRTPLEILTNLINDENPYIASRASRTLAIATQPVGGPRHSLGSVA